MPVLISSPASPSPSAIVSRPGTLSEQVVSGGKAFVETAIAPYLDIADYVKSLSGASSPKPIDYSNQMGEPWAGWVTPGIYSRLKVFGAVLPDGVIMTHCTVTDPLEYSPRSSGSFETPLLVLSAQTLTGEIQSGPDKGKRATGLRKGVANITLKSATTTAAGKEAMEEATRYTTDLGGAKSSSINEVNAKLKQIAKKYNERIGKETIEGHLNKLYIGDALPRHAELRFVLSDMIQPGADYSGDKLLFDRYQLLLYMRAQFCRNPKGADIAPEIAATDGRTTAQRLTSKNLVGRIVKLSSAGLDPYEVTSWVVTRFRHAEVPDSDLIAVQVNLTEYESFDSTNLPTPPIVSPESALGPVPVEVESIERPVYDASISSGVA